jgi:hypothetical protein
MAEPFLSEIRIFSFVFAPRVETIWRLHRSINRLQMVRLPRSHLHQSHQPAAHKRT